MAQSAAAAQLSLQNLPVDPAQRSQFSGQGTYRTYVRGMSVRTTPYSANTCSVHHGHRRLRNGPGMRLRWPARFSCSRVTSQSTGRSTRRKAPLRLMSPAGLPRTARRWVGDRSEIGQHRGGEASRPPRRRCVCAHWPPLHAATQGWRHTLSGAPESRRAAHAWRSSGSARSRCSVRGVEATARRSPPRWRDGRTRGGCVRAPTPRRQGSP
jgi:hypothetical protein